MFASQQLLTRSSIEDQGRSIMHALNVLSPHAAREMRALQLDDAVLKAIRQGMEGATPYNRAQFASITILQDCPPDWGLF